VGTLETVTLATDTPVTVEDARRQCRLYDDTSFDDLLLRLITAATEEIEQETGMCLVQRTLLLRLDAFPEYEMDLQTYPAQSITSVKYDDSTNVEVTLANTEYYLRAGGMVPLLVPKTYWPTTYPKLGAVRVTFVAGYASVEAVPPDLEQAILMRVYDHWNTPGTVDTGTSTIKMITNRYRRHL